MERLVTPANTLLDLYLANLAHLGTLQPRADEIRTADRANPAAFAKALLALIVEHGGEPSDCQGIWYSPGEQVYWVSLGDWTEEPVWDAVGETLTQADRLEAEAYPPRDGDWQVLHPSPKSAEDALFTRARLHQMAEEYARRAGKTLAEAIAEQKEKSLARYAEAIGVTVDDLKARLAKAAEEVHPEPTEGQKQAGNYRKGHVYVQGLDISIENAKGGYRRGVDKNGTAWKCKMQDHYGYVRRLASKKAAVQKGKDGDCVDVFIGPHPESDRVFVVDQIDPANGAFDEHKCVLGARNIHEAETIYRRNYAPGWKGLGAISEMPMSVFKTWLAHGNLKKPVANRAKTDSERLLDAWLSEALPATRPEILEEAFAVAPEVAADAAGHFVTMEGKPVQIKDQEATPESIHQLAEQHKLSDTARTQLLAAHERGDIPTDRHVHHTMAIAQALQRSEKAPEDQAYYQASKLGDIDRVRDLAARGPADSRGRYQNLLQHLHSQGASPREQPETHWIRVDGVAHPIQDAPIDHSHVQTASEQHSLSTAARGLLHDAHGAGHVKTDRDLYHALGITRAIQRLEPGTPDYTALQEALRYKTHDGVAYAAAHGPEKQQERAGQIHQAMQAVEQPTDKPASVPPPAVSLKTEESEMDPLEIAQIAHTLQKQGMDPKSAEKEARGYGSLAALKTAAEQGDEFAESILEDLPTKGKPGQDGLLPKSDPLSTEDKDDMRRLLLELHGDTLSKEAAAARVDSWHDYATLFVSAQAGDDMAREVLRAFGVTE